jgi:hypothetical protein
MRRTCRPPKERGSDEKAPLVAAKDGLLAGFLSEWIRPWPEQSTVSAPLNEGIL